MGGGAEGDTEEVRILLMTEPNQYSRKSEKQSLQQQRILLIVMERRKKSQIYAKNEKQILPIIPAEEYEDAADENPKDFQII